MKLNYFLIIFLVVLFVILPILPIESDSIISFDEKQNENDKTPLVFNIIKLMMTRWLLV